MMKKISLALLFLALLFVSGCWVYGKGQSTGYVYAVDDGIVWDKVWFKSGLESSSEDCYLVKDDDLKQALRNIESNQKIKIEYQRHFFTLGFCGEEGGTDDEILSFSLVN